MQNVLRSQSPTEEDQQQAVDTSWFTLETFVRTWGPIWIYLVKQTPWPFSDLFPAYWMTLLVLPLFSFAVKREKVEYKGIPYPSASRLRQAHGRVPQLKPSASSPWFLISGHTNDVWNGSIEGFLVFRTYYRLLRTLIITTRIAIYLLGSWSFKWAKAWTKNEGHKPIVF